MAMNFPSAPANGQEFTSGGATYVYNGTGWVAKPLPSAYVAKTGDTMTGDLTIAKSNASLTINSIPSGEAWIGMGGVNGTSIWGARGDENDPTKARWGIFLGAGTLETGSNVGSDFEIWRCQDNGAIFGSAVNIFRRNGQVDITSGTLSSSPTTGALTVAGGLGVSAEIYSGPVNVIHSSDTAWLNLAGTGGGSIWGYRGTDVYDQTLLRWMLAMPNNSPESTAENGSDLVIQGFDDNGDGIPGSVLWMVRSDGRVGMMSTTPSTSHTTGALVVSGGIGTSGLWAYGSSLFQGVSANLPALPAVMKMTFNIGAGQHGFSIRNAADSGYTMHFSNSADTTVGAILTTASTTTYQTSSDVRGKPNRELLPTDAAREIIDALEVYDFDKDGNTIRGIGLVAQQAHAVHKSLASPGQTEQDWWMAEKAAPVPFMIANIQQLNKRIDELERQLEERK